VANFVDPERWEPNGETVYRPEARNRLALMRWAVGQADLESCGKALLALRAEGYNDTNWLGKKPILLVESDYGMSEALKALGQEGQISKVWEMFATETGRTCAQCVFDQPWGVKADEGLNGHCKRWYESKDVVETCEGFIGMEDPVVVSLGIELRRWFEKLEIEVQGEPFTRVTDVAEYVQGYKQAVAAKREQREAAAVQAAREHVDRIQAFMDWQEQQPAEWMEHFQAHACVKCANYRPDLETPCRFCVEALGTSWDKERFRAPEFGVLVGRDGRMLPRCEQFVYRETPVLARKAGVMFGEHRKDVLEWLHGLAVGNNSSSRGVLWGTLRWLDYGRPVKTAQDLERMKRWLRREWEALGGDEAMATLMDVALSEGRARASYRGAMSLVNGETGEVEEWAGVNFKFVSGEYENRWGGPRVPEGWPRPWESEEGG
jgi:hypothetical protein